ncbi:MAG: beta-propeller domain-containing protein [Clostridia bacterium]|nr:beta-propeller domain-containing protein [Clostridia bacterium]
MKRFFVVFLTFMLTVFALSGCADKTAKQAAQNGEDLNPTAVLKAVEAEPNNADTINIGSVASEAGIGTLPKIINVKPVQSDTLTMSAKAGVFYKALAANNKIEIGNDGFGIYKGGKLAAYGNKPLRIASYAALAELVNKEFADGGRYAFPSDFASKENAVAEDTASGMGGGGGSSDHSQTNLQVEGVDEGDIIKTDGKYIYVSANDGILILNADLSKAAFVAQPKNTYINEFYVDKNRLTVLGNMYKDDEVTIQENQNGVMTKMVMPISKQFTCATVYDTADIANVSELKSYKIEGYLSQSRKQGNTLYLVTTKYIYKDSGEGKEIVPLYYDSTVGGAAKPLPITDMLCLPYPSPQSSFTTVSAIDTAVSDKAAAIEAFIGGNENIYMNEKGLYLISSQYDYSDQNWNVDTVINSFAVEGLKVEYKATGKVEGSVLNQFSMNEHNGYFGIATTENGNNRLFMLDEALNCVGSVENLAEGERIYAVRFMDDTAYVVTFENMDPLFVINLKNPAAPKVLGELKIPGFSNYLHPVAEGYLLGIGQDTTEIYKKDRNGNEVVIGVQQEGIKLSLFDVRDPANPKEADTFVIGENGSYTDVFYNHKALLTKPVQSLFGFNAALAYGKSFNYMQSALIFKVDATGIELKAKLPAKENANNDYTLYAQGRLCYIGNTLYYVQNDMITAYDMQTYKEINSQNF